MPIPPELKERLFTDENVVKRIGVPSLQDLEVLEEAWDVIESARGGSLDPERLVRSHPRVVIDLVVDVLSWLAGKSVVGNGNENGRNGYR